MSVLSSTYQSTTQPTQHATARTTMLDQLAPRWSREAAAWVTKQDDRAWRVAVGVVGCIVLALGLTLLVGGGYTSIQGVRIPLWRMGLLANADGIPAPIWWLIPIGNTAVQIICRHVPFLRPLWRPSIVYDGTTNALFFTAWLERLAGSYAMEATLIPLGLASAALGLLVAVLAEKLFLAALVLMRAAR